MAFIKNIIKTCVFALLLLGPTCLYGQTFAEWFSQKKTQRKYLVQQIAALNAYRLAAVKGYHMAKGGLGAIGGYLSSEYLLHDTYYSGLKKVNPAIKNDPQVKDILIWQQAIITTTAQLKRQQGLTADEAAYVKSVCGAVLKDCNAELSDLETIISDNKSEMSDEERLRQIGRLHSNMQDNYCFVAGFVNQLKGYLWQRSSEKKNVNTLKSLYENR